ncbi:sensor domain-containing diguanylate cyclase [Shewanella surugensis]|uniref:diguanylate cyclase n=1 Tax=Shewanella surugensis TaxID=212020 RepID=A0ABT0LF39_9GAMM|nr:diguanylate cyclase [Shewanella surugensis]MCL1126314.1 sensor domain-containing diguanylate cyclase [Shewanella surugensis]
MSCRFRLLFAVFFFTLLNQTPSQASTLSLANTAVNIDQQTPGPLSLATWLNYTIKPTSNIINIKKLPDHVWQHLPATMIKNIDTQKLWVKFNLYSNDIGSIHRILSLDNPHLDKINLYHFNEGELVSELFMGDRYPFTQRPIINNNFVYSFDINPNEQHAFYLEIDTKGHASIPLTLWSVDDFTQYSEHLSLLHGFQLGALASIGLFSLFIAITSGSFSYSYYAGYVFSITLFVATLYGIAFRFIWPQWPILQQFMVPVLLPLSMIFGLLFTEKILQLKRNSPHMLKLCRYGISYAVILLLFSPFLPYELAIDINIISLLANSSLLMFMAIIQGIKGHKLAKLYTLGCSTVLIGSLISGLMYLDILSLPFQPQIPFMLGLSFEIIFMAAVLAIRYNDERQEKFDIQQKALDQAEQIRQNKEQALLVEAKHNEKLELMVQERTLELEIALRELNQANAKLTEQTTIDSLTGVKNRNAFDKRLLAEVKISRRQQSPLAILMLDIDRFKSINDSFGHLAGDHALRLIANALSVNLKRPMDLVSRFGGEEFAIILPDTNESGAINVAESIRQSISELNIYWDTRLIKLTISIGVSCQIINKEADTPSLLDQADKALYRAKNEGRNQVQMYSPDLILL